MANYNRVIMMGNLTRDPEYKQLSSGQAVCRLGLASNRQFRNRQTDSMVQEVCFVDIDVWGPQADSCNQYLQKGRSIMVEGRLKFDTWQDNNGQTRSKHIIVADRVLFLSQAATTEVGATNQRQEKQTPEQAKLEKDLLGQIDAIKSRAQVKPAKAAPKQAAPKKEEVPAGSVAFKDQPPFEDDLPF
ncbi:single-stranded DNA-binding protein [bacterium]|nr:single-stranded DNA-binding protein [bacterium]